MILCGALGFIRRNIGVRFKATATTVSLSNLRPAPGSTKKAKRVGRGYGSGGRLCGRGLKGQNSRSGGGPPSWFEGGQTPFHLTVPKRGFTNPNSKKLCHVTLERIQQLIDTGRLDPSQPITIRRLFEAGGFSKTKDGVKVIAGPRSFIFGATNNGKSAPLLILASRFSRAAIERIEEVGGIAVSVYHSAAALRAILRPRPSNQGLIGLAPVSLRERLFYESRQARGYLNPEILERLRTLYPTFTQEYQISPPTTIPYRPPIPILGVNGH